jgi:hypothetical protein
MPISYVKYIQKIDRNQFAITAAARPCPDGPPRADAARTIVIGFTSTTNMKHLRRICKPKVGRPYGWDTDRSAQTADRFTIVSTAFSMT